LIYFGLAGGRSCRRGVIKDTPSEWIGTELQGGSEGGAFRERARREGWSHTHTHHTTNQIQTQIEVGDPPTQPAQPRLDNTHKAGRDVSWETIDLSVF
jgi:hypothetical protein